MVCQLFVNTQHKATRLPSSTHPQGMAAAAALRCHDSLTSRRRPPCTPSAQGRQTEHAAATPVRDSTRT